MAKLLCSLKQNSHILKIAMGNSSRPDFNVLEVAGVKKDKQELIMVLKDMADHLPKENPSKGNA